MAAAVSQVGPALIARTVDQRVMLYDVTWDQYEATLAMRGESSGVRIAYLKGALELISPSFDHEAAKKKFARLLEAYAEELGIEFEGIGSWTLKQSKEERGVEPDECYLIGPHALPVEAPDLALEIIWTSGGLDKLEIYRKLNVREVWVWEKGAITLFGLQGDQYQTIVTSLVLPDVDLDLVAALMNAPSQSAAVRELRAALGARRGG